MSLDGEEWIIMIHIQQIKNQGQRLGGKILQYDAFIGDGETYEINKGLGGCLQPCTWDCMQG